MPTDIVQNLQCNMNFIHSDKLLATDHNLFYLIVRLNISTLEQNQIKYFPKVITKVTAWKVSKYEVFSGPYFPAFGLDTERYGISLHIQSECGKIRTRKNIVFRHFSRSEWFDLATIIRSSCTGQATVTVKVYYSSFIWH